MLTARRQQRTIAREAEVRGVGFLKGCDVRLRFLPAEADAGVVFVRTDLPDHPSVRACIDNVVPRERRTTIQQGAATVEMVEHVMAALAGLRIDNCRVEIDAPETPGCDGSSQAFVEAVGAAGSVELDRPRKTLVVDRPVAVREGAATLAAHPAGEGSAYVLSYHLHYGPNHPIGSQSKFVEVTPEAFVDELAPCRTFLLEAEAKALRQAGIGSRTTESDLLIFGPNGVIGNTLRYPDECVRHKILDMVGDLALCQRDIIGHVVAHRSGHQLNAALVRALRELEGDDDAARGDDSSCLPMAMDIARIMEILPHRYPFLLVDRVLEIEPGRRLKAIKNVTVNEPFFQGHWPGRPIMPGVLILEAIAQAAGLMIADFVDPSRKLTVIAAIDEVKIRRPVTPGDQIELDVSCLRLRAGSAHVQGSATVGGQLAAECKMKFVMIDADRSAA